MQSPDFWWREPGFAAALLGPFGFLYGSIAAARLARSGARAHVPVICVGNPTVGGAGKTPMAIEIARMLIASGRKPAFLTRGYGGALSGPVRVDPTIHRAADVGDEPLLLARTALAIVSSDRAAGARLAEQSGADVIVMDDGFQNPSLQKDLSFLVVDARRGLGNGRVLPAGPLRAPLAPQLNQAQALVIVGEGSAAGPIVEAGHKYGLPILRAQLEPDPAAVARLAGRRLLAFAGLGDPDKFFATLAGAGLAVEKRFAFPDHHAFSSKDEADLRNQAARADLVPVTTEKDLVRLNDPGLKSKTVALPVRLKFAAEERVRTLLLDLWKAG